jgi:hypothetical protein
VWGGRRQCSAVQCAIFCETGKIISSKCTCLLRFNDDSSCVFVCSSHKVSVLIAPRDLVCAGTRVLWLPQPLERDRHPCASTRGCRSTATHFNRGTTAPTTSATVDSHATQTPRVQARPQAAVVVALTTTVMLVAAPCAADQAHAVVVLAAAAAATAATSTVAIQPKAREALLLLIQRVGAAHRLSQSSRGTEDSTWQQLLGEFHGVQSCKSLTAADSQQSHLCYLRGSREGSRGFRAALCRHTSRCEVAHMRACVRACACVELHDSKSRTVVLDGGGVGSGVHEDTSITMPLSLVEATLNVALWLTFFTHLNSDSLWKDRSKVADICRWSCTQVRHW